MRQASTNTAQQSRWECHSRIPCENLFPSYSSPPSARTRLAHEVFAPIKIGNPPAFPVPIPTFERGPGRKAASKEMMPGWEVNLTVRSPADNHVAQIKQYLEVRE